MSKELQYDYLLSMSKTLHDRHRIISAAVDRGDKIYFYLVRGFHYPIHTSLNNMIMTFYYETWCSNNAFLAKVDLANPNSTEEALEKIKEFYFSLPEDPRGNDV